METGIRERDSRARRGAVIIGLLGGIASGKSRIAALLVERGAQTIDADALAHGELERPEVREAVAAAFGPEVLDAGGAVDRRALAARVFDDPAALAKLEAIVHPGVIAAIGRALEATDAPAIVLDVPLLAESGLAALCDELIFVDASRETRVARARARGWSEAELARREARQRPLEEKRAAATAVINNDGDLERTRRQVEEFWRRRVEGRS